MNPETKRLDLKQNGQGKCRERGKNRPDLLIEALVDRSEDVEGGTGNAGLGVVVADRRGDRVAPNPRDPTLCLPPHLRPDPQKRNLPSRKLQCGPFPEESLKKTTRSFGFVAI